MLPILYGAAAKLLETCYNSTLLFSYLTCLPILLFHPSEFSETGVIRTAVVDIVKNNLVTIVRINYYQKLSLLFAIFSHS